MREQRSCNLTVRLRWASGPPEAGGWATFTCAEDDAMARTAARAAAASAPAGDRIIGVDVSPTGGRADDWRTL